jgi:hypothetical protein
MIWDRQSTPRGTVLYRKGDYLRNAKFFPIHVTPEPEYPVGRKGLMMASAWETLGKRANCDGMIVLDGDVAVDPTHVAAMFDAIDADPQVVWTAPVRIWPVSTHRADWVWAHWKDRASQNLDNDPLWFSFCFTYLPAQLLNFAIAKGMKTWVYPRVDANVSAQAQKLGVKARMIEDCFPVHLHY